MKSMGAGRQLWLPKLRGVKRIKKTRRSPQPRVSEFGIIRQYEIFHRPFDLRFRGRINEWLSQIKSKKKFKLREVLDNYQFRVVKLYFFPRKPDSRWLNQLEVLEKIDKTSKKKLRAALISSLIRIWKKDRII